MKKIFALCFLCFSIAYSIVLEDMVTANVLDKVLDDKTVCFYMGAFDPIHLGHEQVVKEGLKNADYVIIYPSHGTSKFSLKIMLESFWRVLLLRLEKK